MSEVILVGGVNGGGKTTYTQENFPHHHRLNRDTIGGKLESLCDHLDLALRKGEDKIVLDNTYATVESRKSFIECARKHGAKVSCFWINTTKEDAMINVCMRMLGLHNAILSPDEIKVAGAKNPGIFPIAAIYGFFGNRPGHKYAPPTLQEGFDEVVVVPFVRKWPADWVNPGIIFDYDDTLRCIKPGSGCTTKYPTKPEHIDIMPRRKEVLNSWASKGYRFFGASNQSGVDKGVLTHEDAVRCFEHTNQLLGHDIPVNFCPHRAGAAICYCRKPAPGLLISHMWKYKLDPNKTIFVGDQTTDKTAAMRLGITYYHESEFFKS